MRSRWLHTLRLMWGSSCRRSTRAPLTPSTGPTNFWITWNLWKTTGWRFIPKEELAAFVWVDAGSQNRPDGFSTQGIVVGVASKDLLEGMVKPVSMVVWHSQKIERKCRSPGAAEAIAAVNGEDALFYVRFQLAEMLGSTVDVRAINQTLNEISGCLVTDSRNVYDKLETETFNIRGAEKELT